MEQIKIDIVPAGISPVAHASQFDTSRQIRFNLFNQGAAYTLTGAETVTMVVNGEEESITNTSDNYVIWDVAEEDCETSGVIACELRIVLGSMLIGSKNFFLEVEMDPYDGKNLRIVTVGPSDICTFETDLAEPLVSVKSAIVASGGYSDGTPHAIVGYTGLNLTACGVNLFDKTATDVNNGYVANSYIRVNGTTLSDVDCDVSEYIRIGSGVDITLKPVQFSNPSICFYDINKTFISGETYNGRTTVTTTTPANTAYIRFSIIKANIDSTQLELGSTPTTYHAYNGTTYPISWQDEVGTVYGGYVWKDVNGVWWLAVTTAQFSDLGSRSWTLSSTPHVFYNSIGNLKPGYDTYLLCEQYKKFNGYFADMGNNQICVNNTYPIIYIRNDNCDTSSDIETALTNCGLVYELATPYTVQLSAKQVRALSGVNNVFGDTGETEVKYLAEE